jgi:NADP-dependent 3-hydroxy acid dehydrogenase YdfG
LQTCSSKKNPLKHQAIAEAILWILEHPAEAAKMGQCGQKAVHQEYD